MKVAVQRWGNSLAVRIPKAIVLESHLDRGSVVEMKVAGGKIVLVPTRTRKYRLEDLLAQITDDNVHREISTGRPVGKERW